jgi:hypothetical protein
MNEEILRNLRKQKEENEKSIQPVVCSVFTKYSTVFIVAYLKPATG